MATITTDLAERIIDADTRTAISAARVENTIELYIDDYRVLTVPRVSQPVVTAPDMGVLIHSGPVNYTLIRCASKDISRAAATILQRVYNTTIREDRILHRLDIEIVPIPGFNWKGFRCDPSREDESTPWTRLVDSKLTWFIVRAGNAVTLRDENGKWHSTRIREIMIGSAFPRRYNGTVVTCGQDFLDGKYEHYGPFPYEKPMKHC